MQDLPSQSSPLPDDFLLQWLSAFHDACVHQNVEIVSIHFIEKNIMTVLREVDARRAGVSLEVRQAAESWAAKQQQQQTQGAQPMHLQHVSIHVPKFLSKACEAFGPAARFVDAVVRAKSKTAGEGVGGEDAVLHNAVRAMQFSTCIPLLMRVAAIVTEVVDTTRCGQYGMVSTVTLPNNVSALLESARNATGALLRTSVGSRVVHYLHLGTDMMKACEGLFTRQRNMSSSSSSASKSTDELSKFSVSSLNWLSQLLTYFADLRPEDLVRTMSGSAGHRQQQALITPMLRGNNSFLSQIDAIPPLQYINFLRNLCAQCQQITPQCFRSLPALKRLAEAFCLKVPVLCDRIAAELQSLGAGGSGGVGSVIHGGGGGGPLATVPLARVNVAQPSQPLVVEFGKTRAQNIHVHAHPHPTQTLPTTISSCSIAGCELAEALLGATPSFVADQLNEALAARNESRRVAHALATCMDSSISTVAFPDVTLLSSQADITARPAELSEFYKKCFFTVQAANTCSGVAQLPSFGDVNRFQRSIVMGLACSAPFLNTCQSALGQHTIPQPEAEQLVASTVSFYETKCVTLSNAVHTAQQHNAQMAEAASAQRHYAKTLEQAIDLIRRVASAGSSRPLPTTVAARRQLQQQVGGGGVAEGLLSRVLASEAELVSKMGGSTVTLSTQNHGQFGEEEIFLKNDLTDTSISPHNNNNNLQQQQPSNMFSRPHANQLQQQSNGGAYFQDPVTYHNAAGACNSVIQHAAGLAATPSSAQQRASVANANPFAVSGAVHASPTFAWRQ